MTGKALSQERRSLSASVAPRPRLGVILSQFPRHDEAFLLRDLQALSAGYPDLVIFSLRPCRDKVIHAQAKRLQPQTVYAPFVFSWKVWASHAWFLRQRPAAYFSALGWILSRTFTHPIVLVKTLFLFPKTVHFARLAQEEGITLMHAGWATYPATSAWITRRLTGIPFTVAGHAHDLYTANPALREKLSAARFVVTCTEENKRFLDRLTQGSAHVHVSYHGVDLLRFLAVPKPVDGPCRILIVGSLLPCKGLETLIEGCRILKSRGLPFHCTLAGGGPLEKKLRALITRYSLLEYVEITGSITQEAVVDLYQKAHVFVLPLVSKIHWGIPNVVIEALATKTPVVCCDLPSMRELVIHKETGWIIPESNPDAVAGAVEMLWKEPVLRERLSEAGLARVTELFSLELTGAKLRALFAQAMSR